MADAERRQQEIQDKLDFVEGNIKKLQSQSLTSSNQVKSEAELLAIRKKILNDGDEHAEEREEFIRKMK